MNTAKLIDGANIEYAPGRIMECRAITDDTRCGWVPVNFFDYFEENTATEMAIFLSRIVTDYVLRQREQPIEGSLPLPEASSYPASRVFDFLHNLGIEPKGRLAYVEGIPHMNVRGITDYQSFTSLIDKRNTSTYSEESMALSPENAYLGGIFNAMRVQGVAVHELTHLAGAQDVVNFFVDSTASKVTQVVVQGTTLEDWPGVILKKRCYLEEGLASLVHAMYFWRSNTPDLPNHRSERHEVYKRPSGRKICIPTRISNPLSGHHEYVGCAWGIERLVECMPRLWDALIDSRRYGARALSTRNTLKTCINSEIPGLFEQIDSVDVNNIEETLGVTERIDFEVARRKL